MPANCVHYDGICRRQLIRAIIAKARQNFDPVPSQTKIGAMLGISQSAVSYHMDRLKSVTPQSRGIQEDYHDKRTKNFREHPTPGRFR